MVRRCGPPENGARSRSTVRVPFTLRYSSAEQTESGQTDSSLVPKVLFRIAREAREGADSASIRVIKARGKKEGKKERGREKGGNFASISELSPIIVAE